VSFFSNLRSAGALPVEGHLAGFDGATGWLNSPPLSAADLQGKVVLADFWTYTCINWLRTLAFVRAWAGKYQDQGLVVVGVHTPEFPFERDVDNVRQAVDGDARITRVGRIIRNLRFDLANRRVLFIFDESQHLSIDCLETIRELLDQPPHAGLLFLGSHESEKTFDRLDMEQWGDRVRQAIELPGIQESEAAHIIESELGQHPQNKVNALIKQCYGTDLRKGRECKYISARKLFFAIQAIQEQQEASR